MTWNLGPGQLYAMYGQAQKGTGSALDGQQVGAVRKGENTGAQQWEVSYTYALSKRTLMYAGYVQIANKSNGAYNFGVNVDLWRVLADQRRGRGSVRRLRQAARHHLGPRPLLLRGQPTATSDSNKHQERAPSGARFFVDRLQSIDNGKARTGSICG